MGDINPDDLQGLFDLLDTGNGSISTEEFVCGSQRLKGSAKNIDMAHLLVIVGKMEGTVDRILEKLENEIAVRLELLEQRAPRSRQQRWQPAEPVHSEDTMSLVMKGIADLVPGSTFL